MATSLQIPPKVEALLKRGLVIPCPASVEVGDDVDPERLAPGVVIHTGCKVLGAKTSIGPKCAIGAEAPATVDDCQLGHSVALKGGYFSGATFLDGANMGSGSHVRPGTLLEEEASAAHSVAFKQTIFLSFVTAGSLINFCDALMAGGTSRKNHSEIGSSYIHFNYTPHQDKATPSLIGDVPHGVMLDRPPVFLGGQGGLVGPSRIAFGCVIAAGAIYRDDALEEGLLLRPAPLVGTSRPYTPGAYREIGRVVRNNLIYIGNIRALQAWYRIVRRRAMTRDPFSAACHEGALAQLAAVVDERIKRLGELAGKMPRSLELARAEARDERSPYHAAQEQFMKQWPEIEAQLKEAPPEQTGTPARDRFLSAWERMSPATPYLQAVGSLSAEARTAGATWLQAIVDSVAAAGKGLGA